MPRMRLTFRVNDARDRWLQPDATWGLELTAAQFVMHAEPTISEDIRIQANLHTLAGGAVAWEELLATYRELDEVVEKEICAGPLSERPKIDDDGVEREVNDAEWAGLVRATRLVWLSPAGEALRRTDNMVQRLGFLATWSVLAVEAPPLMRSLEAMDNLPVETLDLIERAVNIAKREHDAGKAPSSPS